MNRAKVRDVLYTLCANKDGGVPLAVMRWCTRGQVCASEVRWEKEARRADVEIDRGRNKKNRKVDEQGVSGVSRVRIVRIKYW